MGKQYPDRQPDIETPSFRLWKVSKEEDEQRKRVRVTLSVNYDEGEEMYETRVYQGILGYRFFIGAKVRPDGMIYPVAKLDRPDGTTAVNGQKEWITGEEYKALIKRLEDALSPVMDIAHAVITLGKHYTLYVKGEKRSR